MVLLAQVVMMILEKFGKMMYDMIPEEARPPIGFLKKLKRPFQFIQGNSQKSAESERAKLLAKILKALAKAIAKSLRALWKAISFLFFNEIGLCIILIVVVFIAMWSMLGLFGAYQGKINVDIATFQNLNRDESIEEDARNTNALRKSYFEYVSYTGFYQMFNLRDMNETNINPFLKMVQAITNDLKGYDELKSLSDDELNAINKEIIDGQSMYNRGIMGLLGLDPRYIYTDANKNPLKYMKSAMVVGKSTENSKINSYFRDYFNKEKSFMLSESLLSEMNRIIYGEFIDAESITYPEAFVKPISFVNDFMRVEDNSGSTLYGQEYVYNTKRVTLEEIQNPASRFFRKNELEGLIYSRPSHVVYDYAVIDKNIYLISNNDSDTAKQVNIGNISKYAELEEDIEYLDGSTDKKTTAIKLYWRVKDSELENDSTVEINDNAVNPYNYHMGVPINNKTFEDYFEGPYLECDSFGNLFNKIDPNTYEMIDGMKIRWEYNKYPNRHMQVVPIMDEGGQLQISSRMLFNKTFVQKKSIKESYRHFSEYYSGFEAFVEQDLARGAPQIGMSFDNNDTQIAGGNANCTDADYKTDLAKSWGNRRCSTIRRYTGVHGYAYLKGKFAEMGASISGGSASDAEIDISSNAMLHIIMEYEDYLIETGKYGVAWEYKYYTASEFDKMAISLQFSDIYGLSETFIEPWSDELKYKYPMDTIKMLDNKRTFSTEYVPVAEISGTGIKNGDYDNVNMNQFGYGWRMKDLNDGHELEKVAGEASLEFPTYYTGSLKDFFATTLFGTVTYGANNFAYEWDSNGLSNFKPQGNLGFDAEMSEELAKEQYHKDYRNKDYVWNPNVEVFKPVGDIRNNETTTIAPSSTSGRVTFSSNPKDYLPMEVKSVRDYGLGSVLSYIEGRKVVFRAGAFMDEGYSKDFVKTYFANFTNKQGIAQSNTFSGSEAERGFYPIEITSYDPVFLPGAKPTQFPIENLKTVADGVLKLQYAATDEEMEESDNRLELLRIIQERESNGYSVLGLDTVNQGFSFKANSADVNGANIEAEDSMITSESNAVATDLSSGGTVRAFSPYLTVEGMAAIAQFFFGTDPQTINASLSGTQYLDPLQYYLEWFDQLQSPDDIYSRLLDSFDSSKLVSKLDNDVAATLRARQATNEGFDDISNQKKNLVSSLFDSAGEKYVPKFKEKFYAENLSAMQPFDLIDRVQTQKIYMIEEAATFIGTFNYTYKDEISDLGQFGNKQVIDLIFANRYYYISNYIFAQAVAEYTFGVQDYDKGVKSDACAGFSSQRIINDKNNSVFRWFDSEKAVDADCYVRSRVEEEDDSDWEIVDGKLVITTGTKSVTYYDKAVVVTYTKPTGINDAYKVDTYEEVQKVMQYLPDSINEKIMINTKVYRELDSVFSSNTYAFDEDFAHDYGESATVIGGDNESHYEEYKDVYDAVSSRNGYKGATYEGQPIDIENMPLVGPDVDDTLMNVDLDVNPVTISKLTDEERGQIADAIIKAFDDGSTLYDGYVAIDSDWSVSVQGGTELLPDKDYTLYGLSIADRADYGYPIPVYRHFSGNMRQVLPTEKGAYINGETIDSWTKRLIVDENATYAKAESVKEEKEVQQSYIYDYITNFEAYIPYNVKTDYDLMSRGREPYHSIIQTENSTVSNTASYTSDILNQLQSEAWKETIAKFKEISPNISDVGIAQNIAGIIETSIQIAPERMIKVYNAGIQSSSEKFLISNENMMSIRDSLKGSLANSSTSLSNKVTLKMENGRTKSVSMLYFGSGAIFADISKTDSATLSTRSFGSSACGSTSDGYQHCFNDISLSAGTTEDRTNHALSLQYVTTSFGKLMRTYGSIPKSLMAYFYGESYVSAMDSVTSSDDWLMRDVDSDISAALALIASNPSIATENIDTTMYSSSVVKKVMSYIADLGSRTDSANTSIRPDTGSGPTVIGSEAHLSMEVYNRWKPFFDAAAAEYNVDLATMVAIVTRESGGNHLAGVCGYLDANGDGGVTHANWQSRTCANPVQGNEAIGLGQHFDLSYNATHPYTLPMNSSTGNLSAVYYKYDGTTSLTEMIQNDSRTNPATSLRMTANTLRQMIDMFGEEDTLIYVGAYGIGGGAMRSVLTCREGGTSFDQCFRAQCRASDEDNQLEKFKKYYAQALKTKEVNLGTPTGSGTGAGSGIAGSGNGSNSNAVKDTGKNYYNRDLFTFQNSGVELYETAGRLTKTDVDLILLSGTNYATQAAITDGPKTFNFYPQSYGIMDLFTKKEYSGLGGIDGAGIGSGGGLTWVGMNANLVSIGPASTWDTKPSLYPLNNIPPMMPFSYPFGSVVGRNTAFFGTSTNYVSSDFHDGHDLAAPAGTPVYSVAPGRVTSVTSSGAYGNKLDILHTLPADTTVISTTGKRFTITSIKTRYAHNTSVLARNGDLISESCSGVSNCRSLTDPVALVGSTGNSSGNHLHFEIILSYVDENGTAGTTKVDPSIWLFAQWAA